MHLFNHESKTFCRGFFHEVIMCFSIFINCKSRYFPSSYLDNVLILRLRFLIINKFSVLSTLCETIFFFLFFPFLLLVFIIFTFAHASFLRLNFYFFIPIFFFCRFRNFNSPIPRNIICHSTRATYGKTSRYTWKEIFWRAIWR